jgi:hypothetical protein
MIVGAIVVIAVAGLLFGTRRRFLRHARRRGI